MLDRLEEKREKWSEYMEEIEDKYGTGEIDEELVKGGYNVVKEGAELMEKYMTEIMEEKGFLVESDLEIVKRAEKECKEEEDRVAVENEIVETKIE